MYLTSVIWNMLYCYISYTAHKNAKALSSHPLSDIRTGFEKNDRNIRYCFQIKTLMSIYTMTKCTNFFESEDFMNDTDI